MPHPQWALWFSVSCSLIWNLLSFCFSSFRSLPHTPLPRSPCALQLILNLASSYRSLWLAGVTALGRGTWALRSFLNCTIHRPPSLKAQHHGIKYTILCVITTTHLQIPFILQKWNHSPIKALSVALLAVPPKECSHFASPCFWLVSRIRQHCERLISHSTTASGFNSFEAYARVILKLSNSRLPWFSTCGSWPFWRTLSQKSHIRCVH